ncbi:MAG: oligosaccharide flippase family protein, partial [Deltaproteobacteria bacterium]|nr:oligosaccharide flippase family protein [Deltaproteobacteria bacterium]
AQFKAPILEQFEHQGHPYYASFQQLVAGLNSTALLTFRRRLRLGIVNALDLSQQLIGMTVMIVWATLSPSVWALLGGSLVGATFFAITSHFLPVGYRNRFAWDRSAYKELSTFGRWILGSSSVTFLANQGDRALFGRFMGAAHLGVYQVAAELAGAASGIVERLVGGVLYPVLSTKGHSDDRAELRRIYYKSRLGLDLIAQGGLGLLCGLGGWLVRLVWDSRYWDAAWMLPLLCIRGATSCLVQPTETCLVSMGLSRYGFMRSLARGVTVWIAIPVGYAVAGVPGLLWGVALSELPALFLMWIPFWRLGMLRLERELLAVVFFLAALAVGTLVNRWLPDWHVPHRPHA